jgi:hypothetical protein
MTIFVINDTNSNNEEKGNLELVARRLGVKLTNDDDDQLAEGTASADHYIRVSHDNSG